MYVCMYVYIYIIYGALHIYGTLYIYNMVFITEGFLEKLA